MSTTNKLPPEYVTLYVDKEPSFSNAWDILLCLPEFAPWLYTSYNNDIEEEHARHCIIKSDKHELDWDQWHTDSDTEPYETCFTVLFYGTGHTGGDLLVNRDNGPIEHLTTTPNKQGHRRVIVMKDTVLHSPTLPDNGRRIVYPYFISCKLPREISQL
jgi:hypothetical protein